MDLDALWQSSCNWKSQKNGSDLSFSYVFFRYLFEQGCLWTCGQPGVRKIYRSYTNTVSRWQCAEQVCIFFHKRVNGTQTRAGRSLSGLVQVLARVRRQCTKQTGGFGKALMFHSPDSAPCWPWRDLFEHLNHSTES